MQHQLCSQITLLMETLLCQHSLFISKVIVSSVEEVAGREEGQMMDGGLHGRVEGGALIPWYPVCSPEMSDNAVAAFYGSLEFISHPFTPSFILLLTQIALPGEGLRKTLLV